MKPFLKWAGGKRQLHSLILPIVKRYLSSKNTYYEPFIGAGSVFLELEHCHANINDSNQDLMICYEVIKNNPDELISKLNEYKISHSKDIYYRIRSLDRNEEVFNCMTPVEKAARVIYLNKTCFNGLYRVNKKGQFNTPIGSHKNPSIFDADNIKSISRYLNDSNIIIQNTDFVNAVRNAKSGDFIYFDPPYDYETKGFSDYQKEGFSEIDLIRLKKTCDRLIEIGCHVLISNHATKRVLDLFSDNNYELINLNYDINLVEVKRYIGSKVDYRKKAQEVLIHGWKK